MKIPTKFYDRYKLVLSSGIPPKLCHQQRQFDDSIYNVRQIGTKRYDAG